MTQSYGQTAKHGRAKEMRNPGAPGRLIRGLNKSDPEYHVRIPRGYHPLTWHITLESKIVSKIPRLDLWAFRLKPSSLAVLANQGADTWNQNKT
jgi:hypothetical protein